MYDFPNKKTEKKMGGAAATIGGPASSDGYLNDMKEAPT
ncbi:hypothetical protein KNP414_07394 [Paenibacillus mucilaginosus KNP414]|uniref:Uncharacterized protein n=1 Tax=Paenibacillus mucilaginosus (strain KNP414) TaxID=1036673 RepID=F8FPT1_PAEMK|nr:hypothetical protein KNP414_07394 [Paenibacillus mucilaginosus KNP414]